jgi:glycosyltransferase involved in cell wall biosynthesis
MLTSTHLEKSPLKVLLFAYACKPNSGSEAGAGWNWAWHLAEVGNDVWVLTNVEGKDSIEEELSSNSLPNLHFIYVETPAWIQRYIRGRLVALYGYYAHYLGWQKQAYNRALNLDKEHDFDLVHHVTWSGVNTGSWLCYLNKPFIFGPVGGGQVAPPAFKKYFHSNWKLETVRSLMVNAIKFNRLVTTTINRADLVLTTNNDTLNLVQKLGARRVEHFLDIALPENYFPPELPIRSTSPELRLLWVGGIFPRKGLRLALESLTQVSDSVPFKMTILGGGYLSDFVPSWLKEFGVENRVNYRGKIPWIEVKDEYLNSDVFFFTSLRDSTGMQLLESLAQGLPIIGLNHQGVRDFVPDNASIKVAVTNPTETVQGLAKAIEYMFEHPEKRLEMGRVGYEFSKQYTWKQNAIKMSQYYQEVAKKQSITNS